MLSTAGHYVDQADVEALRAKVVPAGSILFAKIGEAIRQNHRVIAGCPMLIDNNAMAAIPGAKVEGRFLYHYLKTVDFYAIAPATTVPALRKSDLERLQIPLPPLPEQRRIAAILDQAETLRTQRRAALAQLDSLTQSIFLDMFGDPVTNPRAWPVVSLTDICHCYSGGTPSKANSAFWKGAVPWFSAKDMKAEDLFDSEDHIAETVPQTTTLKLLPKDTVAIVVRGMILAHTFPVCVLRVPATINQDLKALIPAIPINAQFLAACLRSQAGFVLEQVSEAGHGTKRLDARGLQKIRVLRPEPTLENTFATRVQAIEALKAKHRSALTELDGLFASLQHRAFNGELSAQAPTQPKPRRFAELGQLNASKGLEALVYAARRLPNKGHYWPLKTQYVADRRHLERHGRTIYGETHMAMPYGPVPQAAFNASRALANGELICEFPMDAVRTALRRNGETLVALRDADPTVLGAEERESLDWAIRLVADLSFEELKTQTHDAAWEKTPRNAAMAWQDIIATLDPAAQQGLLATFEQKPPRG